MEDRSIAINVCGKTYHFDRGYLAKNRRNTLLEKFATWSHEDRLKFCHNFTSKPEKIYFIWTNPSVFKSLVHYVATGHLPCPDSVCSAEFLSQLRFWRVDIGSLPNCCKEKLSIHQLHVEENYSQQILANTLAVICENETAESKTDCQFVPLMNHTNLHHNGSHPSVHQTEDDDNSSTSPEDKEPDKFAGIFLGDCRRTAWELLEEPHSSLFAKIFMAISALFVITSVILLILGSMTEFQDAEGEPITPLVHAEYVCVAWFTLEYIVKLLITPARCQYVKAPLNVVDALSLFPFYLEVTFLIAGVNTDDLQNWKGALLALRVLRVLRVSRILKLARFSSGLKSFGNTLNSSRKEISMLFMFLSTAMLLFSTSVYFFEKGQPGTPFTSIPATFWWAVVTMTTVGYGDMIPVSVGGKIVASFATIAGVIVLAFPITMIVENFNNFYQTEETQSTLDDEERRAGKKPMLHIRSVAIV